MRLQRVGLLGDVTGVDVGDIIWLFAAVGGAGGKVLQATGKHTLSLLTPSVCGILDKRQRVGLCCCLAPRWRLDRLTAYGANGQGISGKKLLASFWRPLTIGEVAIRVSLTGEHNPTKLAHRQSWSRYGAAGGGATRRQRRGTR